MAAHEVHVKYTQGMQFETDSPTVIKRLLILLQRMEAQMMA